MLRAARTAASRTLACFLLVWLLVPIALPIVEAVDAALPPGIFDDADDDAIIAILSSLDLQLVAPIPPPPPAPGWPVAGPVAVQRDGPAPSIVAVASPSRSPPLS